MDIQIQLTFVLLLLRFDMSHLNWKKLSDEKYNACYEHCAFLPDCDRQRVFMFGGATKTDNLNSVQTLSLSKFFALLAGLLFLKLVNKLN